MRKTNDIYAIYRRLFANDNPTPAQKAGFEVGDEAVVIGNANGFADGQRVVLHKDDGTIAPLWRGDNRVFKGICGPGVPGAFLSLHIQVRKPTESQPSNNVGFLQ